MSILILDTETTGISKTDQVIELAYYEASTLENEKDTRALNTLRDAISSYRYFPTVPINPHAYAVHGIGLTQLAKSPASTTLTLPKNIKYIVGHNISFDKRILLQSNPKLEAELKAAKYICTLSLAKTISKFAKTSYENHKLDTLAKHYYPEVESLVTPLHSASNDVLKTLLVLLKLIDHTPNLKTWDDIYNFQNKSVK